MSLGADETVDYTSVRFEEVVQDVDVVIDLVGDAHDRTSTRSLETLCPRSSAQALCVEELAVAMTWALRCLAICTARCPTPPAPAWISTRCPAGLRGVDEGLPTHHAGPGRAQRRVGGFTSSTNRSTPRSASAPAAL